MAYAAAVSLKDVLVRLCYFCHGNSTAALLRLMIMYLYQMALSIQAIDFEQEDCPGSRKSLEKDIRDALWRAEDVVESYMLTHFRSSELLDMSPTSMFYQDLLVVAEEITFNKERMDNFAKEDLKTAKKEDLVFPSSKYLPPQCKNKMVGLDEELILIKTFILGEARQQLGAAVIHGMGGIGKTSLAISFYNDPDVRNSYYIGAWLNISFEHCARDILLSLLHTVKVFGHVSDGIDKYISRLQMSDDEELEDFVRKFYAMRSYVVVVDCLCEINETSWAYIKDLLPDSNNESRIVLFNRMELQDDEFIFYCHRKRFLDAHQSWDLLREQVYCDEECPNHALERIGKKIAANCQGLPLAIITTGLHLTKKEKTVEHWNKVAKSGNSIAYEAEGEAMFKQLGLSYKQLTQRLRPIYLYMGTFPEGSKISDIELRNLWVAEGLVEKWEYENYTILSRNWIVYLANRNLVSVVRTEKSNSGFACSLHHALWHFCCRKATEDEFSYVFDATKDGEDSNTDNVRRLIIRNNVLLGVRDVYKSGRSRSTIRSLLLTGPHHPYPLRISFSSNYKLLRVLNALSVRFYEFPLELLYLTLVRYLALTLSRGELPAGISKLSNLKFLIVRLHHIVRSRGGVPSYLPMEIWEMQQLIHLECEGSDLPVPHHQSKAELPILQVLCGVSPHSCTKEVLRRTPNLEIFGINIDVAPKYDAAPFSPFDHLDVVRKLDILSCKITNPYFERYCQPQVVAMPESCSASIYLVVLTLSGCGLPWKNIEPISQFPYLNTLILQCHAFRGPKWNQTKGGFKKLQTLIMEDLDLVYWTAGSGDHFFPCLEELKIIRCHKLQHISLHFVHCGDLEIDVIDSHSAAENWARSVQVERPRNKGRVWVEISSPRVASAKAN